MLFTVQSIIMWKSVLKQIVTLLINMTVTYFNLFSTLGEATLTDAMTAAGKTYEEIAQMVAEQVDTTTTCCNTLMSLP